MQPVWDSFPVLHQNGTVSDQYENNSCRVSDRYGVRPALSSFLGGFHVNAWKEMYWERYELIPVRVRPGLM